MIEEISLKNLLKEHGIPQDESKCHVIKWLRDKYHLFIYVQPSSTFSDKYDAFVAKKFNHKIYGLYAYPTFEIATEAAIKLCLLNLNSLIDQ
jgi:hypothetical protein